MLSFSLNSAPSLIQCGLLLFAVLKECDCLKCCDSLHFFRLDSVFTDAECAFCVVASVFHSVRTPFLLFLPRRYSSDALLQNKHKSKQDVPKNKQKRRAER